MLPLYWIQDMCSDTYSRQFIHTQPHRTLHHFIHPQPPRTSRQFIHLQQHHTSRQFIHPQPHRTSRQYIHPQPHRTSRHSPTAHVQRMRVDRVWCTRYALKCWRVQCYVASAVYGGGSVHGGEWTPQHDRKIERTHIRLFVCSLLYLFKQRRAPTACALCVLVESERCECREWMVCVCRE
jgi:hypothetical protein